MKNTFQSEMKFDTQVIELPEIVSIYLRIAPGRFHFLKFILEGYDNLGTLSSHDSKMGIVLLRFPRDLAGEMIALLSTISSELVE